MKSFFDAESATLVAQNIKLNLITFLSFPHLSRMYAHRNDK